MIPIDLRQGSPEWLRWRRDGIGGSDAGAIWAYARNDDSLWPYNGVGLMLREKIRGVDRETDFAMRRGTRLEPIAREMYCLERSVKATPICGQHSELPWMRASLDGLAQSLDPHDKGQWVIEIKAPAWHWHDFALAGMVPPIYQAQCQHVLFVSGLERLDYVSWNNGQRFAESDHLAVVTVRPDAEMLSELLDAEEDFWKRLLHVRARFADVAKRRARLEARRARWASMEAA